ncbi:MAG: hypothetical protein HYY96_11260 [Candidatus Tectomicrobia bacterium]|nr:hypothetical protein [Candidatus Tectomicrobia bacterium]
MAAQPAPALIGAHLLGSVPLGDARTVMRTCGEVLGGHLHAIPDGETGARTNWIMWQGPEVFAKNPAIITRRLADEIGQWTGGKVTPKQAYGDNFDFGVKPDAAQIAFGELGYAREAAASYAVFRELKAAGVIPATVRFQVSLPSPVNPIVGFLPNAEDQRRAYPAYEAAMLREVGAVCSTVPAAELAVQWDLVMEVMVFEGLRAFPWDDQEGGLRASIARLAAAVPRGAALGFHLCYGDRRHTHLIEPQSLAVSVRLVNLLVAASGRPVNWVHMPVPKERDDAAYFGPLRDLDIGSTDLYLGLMHTTDGLDGARRRLAAAAAFAPRFGVATECGMGRRSPESIRPLLELHRRVLEG